MERDVKEQQLAHLRYVVNPTILYDTSTYSFISTMYLYIYLAEKDENSLANQLFELQQITAIVGTPNAPARA